MKGRTGRARPQLSRRRAHPTRPTRWPWLVSLGAAGIILGPGLLPGYLLLRDMVFVPAPALTGRLLGLGHETPRAVPSDLVVALASHVLPGDLVEKLVLVAILVAAGVGAARLAPRGALPESAAALVAVWNPYVAERLAMGQWALLVGYAALPWVVSGLSRVVHGERSGAGAVVAGLVLGSLGGGLAWVTLGLATVATLVAVSVTSRDVRGVLARSWWVLILGGVLAAPWAVPALLRPQGLTSDPTGFSVFAPHSDTPLGLLASILTGGGAWNSEVVPPGRNTVLGAAGALLVLCWGVFGLLSTRWLPALPAPDTAARARVAVIGTGAVGLVIALLSAAPDLLTPLASVPGGGLLRDGSRQLGMWMLTLAVGSSWGLVWLRARRMPGAALVLAALLPVAVLPSLGWGLSGLLRPVEYPPALAAVRTALGSESGPGSVVVLPFQAYRRYPWNADLTSLTPWPRILDRRVVVSSDLAVATPSGLGTVAGEDAYAVAVRRALGAHDPVGALESLGVGWVVTDAPEAVVPAGATPVLTGGAATVYRLGTSRARADAVAAAYDPPAGPVLTGDLVWLLVLLGAPAIAARRKLGRARGYAGPLPSGSIRSTG